MGATLMALRWRYAQAYGSEEGVFPLRTQPYGFAFARLGLGLGALKARASAPFGAPAWRDSEPAPSGIAT